MSAPLPIPAAARAARLVRIVEVMTEIAADCEADARALDGRPFDGRNVAEAIGTMLAQIRAVAIGVEVLAEAELDE